jgi:hypothetical protein
MVVAGTPARYMPAVTGIQTAASAATGLASRIMRLRSQGRYPPR